jgi:urea transport system substrate-binding protein
MTALRLGILFSTSGDYGVLGRDCHDGAMTAIEELRGVSSVSIEPVVGDPAGSGERYIELARKMLQEDGCRHVIGTVTSQARKDVTPSSKSTTHCFGTFAPMKASRPIRM